jgi:hypothetical protein
VQVKITKGKSFGYYKVQTTSDQGTTIELNFLYSSDFVTYLKDTYDFSIATICSIDADLRINGIWVWEYTEEQQAV